GAHRRGDRARDLPAHGRVRRPLHADRRRTPALPGPPAHAPGAARGRGHRGARRGQRVLSPSSHRERTMASQDKDKIIKPGDPGFHVDAPRPNPGSNTADRLAGALPGAPAPTGRPGDTTAAYESPSPMPPRSAIGGPTMDRPEASPRARRVRERTHEVRGGLNRMWLQADTFLERQVAQRPLGIV